jgi:transposase
MTDTDIDGLPDDPAALKAAMKQLNRSAQQYEARINQLEYRLSLLLKSKYGPRRERFDDGQATLFDVGQVDAQPIEEAAAEPEAVASDPPKRKGHGRRRLPKDLPRERIEHRLPSDALPCPCCGEARRQIGWQTTELLDYEPAKLFIVEHARAKYACQRCQGEVVIADKPPQALQRCVAGTGLLAAVAVGKFSDHLPQYRMEEVLHRSGLKISRSTMGDWLRHLAEALRPLHAIMQQEVLSSRIIWTDDTTVPVLDPTLPKTRTARMWVYIGDLRHRFAVFDYTADRKAEHPRRFLQGYEGYLQADAYGGYDGLCDRGAVTEVACWAHARRKFHEAREVARIGASHALGAIGQLYGIERAAAEKSADERQALRAKHAVRHLTAFKHWLDEQAVMVLPKSPLGEAIRYALNQWPALCRYVEDGELSIDNNLSERTIRSVAIGRKNWMFLGSDRGGKTAEVLMSLVATCKLHQVDPYRYLRGILNVLPTQPTAADLRDLLPDRWLATHPGDQLVDHRPSGD